ncbi:hypothetical protein DUK53_17165 [Listeria sp. SHR_NRA_18]|uniref:hypothetical protein n=1 Tax=Listeria sp. SHR_NRA_18 TaxID=2269046 RepID=UPI000F5DB4F0|nr:hypothetical protein [Listeria sp. SHR_NRA_18]RQW65297.1 hypothetical protein DUK53_17165 [Listeria sp. SHR_NRA_18]
MLEVLFSNGKELDIQEGLRLSYEKAMALGIRKNEELIASNRTGVCQYQLLFEDKMIYESQLKFPYELFDFERIMEEELAGTAEGNVLLAWLADQVHPKKKKDAASKKVKAPREPREKKVREKKQRQPFQLNRPLKLAIAVGTLVLIAVAALWMAPNLQSEEPSYEGLIKSGDYVGAAKMYEDKTEDIRQTLFQKALDLGDKGQKTYRTFAKAYPSKTSTLDIAILDGDYKATIQAYEQSTELFQKDKTRMQLVGYAYLKNKDLEKAKQIEEVYPNLDLEKRLAQYEQLVLSIERREKLMKELQKDPIKNEKAIQATIELLFKDKAALEQI